MNDALARALKALAAYQIEDEVREVLRDFARHIGYGTKSG